MTLLLLFPLPHFDKFTATTVKVFKCQYFTENCGRLQVENDDDMMIADFCPKLDMNVQPSQCTCNPDGQEEKRSESKPSLSYHSVIDGTCCGGRRIGPVSK